MPSTWPSLAVYSTQQLLFPSQHRGWDGSELNMFQVGFQAKKPSSCGRVMSSEPFSSAGLGHVSARFRRFRRFRCSSQGEEQGRAEFRSVHEDFLQHPRPPAAVVAKCASAQMAGRCEEDKQLRTAPHLEAF